MLKGIPVAIENSTNVALSALRNLGVSDSEVSAKLEQYKEDIAVVPRDKVLG